MYAALPPHGPSCPPLTIPHSGVKCIARKIRLVYPSPIAIVMFAFPRAFDDDDDDKSFLTMKNGPGKKRAKFIRLAVEPKEPENLGEKINAKILIDFFF